jgi:DNA polymerase III alpha subunit
VPKLDWITFDEVDYSKARPYVDVGLWRQMELLKKKYDRCVNIFQQKSVGKDEFISFEEFDAGSLEIEKDVRDILKNKEKAEVLYYGFEWDHPLFLCENYNGQTWEEARLNLTKTPQVLPVEVLIKSCEVTQTKTGKNMLKLRCEDGNRQIQTVTVWSEELLRFEEDLQTGACVRLRVKIDKMKDRDGYWYNLESFLWNEKHKVPKNKSQDFRVFVLKAAPKKEEINIEEIANLI